MQHKHKHIRISHKTSFVIMWLGVWLCVGCASHTQLSAPIREAVHKLDLPLAFEHLENSSHLSPDGKNRLLYYLEKARLLHHMGTLSKAEIAYRNGARLASELYTTSLTQGALSFVINDSTMNYAGEEYELVALHAMLAMLFIEKGELQKARVEAKRINTRLKELSRHEARHEVNSATFGYQRDAFALFLSGMIFEALGEYDSAVVDYSKALTSYENNYPGAGVSSSLVESLYQVALRTQRKNMLAMLRNKYGHLLRNQSLSPSVMVIAVGYPVTLKVSKSFVFAAGGQVLRYSWPSIPDHSPSLPFYDVRLQHSGAVSLEMAQNYDVIARTVLEEKRVRLGAKTITRMIAKAKVAHEMHKVHPILGLITSIFGAWVETADTRSWGLLPGKIALKRVPVKPQTSSLKYTTRHLRGAVTFKRDQSLSFLILDYTRTQTRQNSIASILSSISPPTKTPAL
ncbi:MAG: hypothetical protein OXC44_01815 [Proteobacteria bacterium]|nr:hypothetical protein [Pseudomonadota bacterium]